MPMMNCLSIPIVAVAFAAGIHEHTFAIYTHRMKYWRKC